MNEAKLEKPYFLPYYMLVLFAIVVLTVRIPLTLNDGVMPPEEPVVEKIDPTAIAPKAGYLAPDFTLYTTKGDAVTLSQLKGNIVFLNFWATWCKPCREEMPSMQELWDKFKTEKFVMLAVSTDTEREKAVVPFLEELGLTFPVLYDEKGEIATEYETTGVPETFIIGKDGRILYKGIGPQNWSEPDTLEAISMLVNGPKNHGVIGTDDTSDGTE